MIDAILDFGKRLPRCRIGRNGHHGIEQKKQEIGIKKYH